MRLFLASQDFGRHADRLSAMVGDNRKSLVVCNARDLKEDRGIDAQKRLFAANGLEFQELDLRDYFGQPKKLRQFIDEYAPGLVVLLGGNTFLLRRALAQSGFDEILRQDVTADQYVLAGHSAGSIVTGPDLRGFEVMDDPTPVTAGYQTEVLWDGLGLTDVKVIPHADSPKYTEIAVEAERIVASKGGTCVVLGDDAVFVVDGEESEVLR